MVRVENRPYLLPLSGQVGQGSKADKVPATHLESYSHSLSSAHTMRTPLLGENTTQ